MGDDQETLSKLDVIGDPKCREVLTILDGDSCTAKELANRIEVSVATIYRRLNKLEECNFISKRSIVAPDGNHYHVYDCNFEGAVITLQDGEYEVRMFQVRLFADKLGELWNALRHSRD